MCREACVQERVDGAQHKSYDRPLPVLKPHVTTSSDFFMEDIYKETSD